MIAEDLKPPVDELPSVHEVPLSPPSGTSTADQQALTKATTTEDSDISEVDSDLRQDVASDDLKELEDILKKCLASALADIGASYLEGNNINFSETLVNDLFACFKEKFGVNGTISEENVQAAKTLSEDLTGQMDANAVPVIQTGLSSQEFGSWLQDTANTIPGEASQASSDTTTTSPPEPSPHKSSSPIAWIVIGVIVVGGVIVVIGKK